MWKQRDGGGGVAGDSTLTAPATEVSSGESIAVAALAAMETLQVEMQGAESGTLGASALRPMQNVLQDSSRRIPKPAYVPEYLPEYPDPHTFKQTPVRTLSCLLPSPLPPPANHPHHRSTTTTTTTTTTTAAAATTNSRYHTHAFTLTRVHAYIH